MNRIIVFFFFFFFLFILFESIRQKNIENCAQKRLLFFVVAAENLITICSKAWPDDNEPKDDKSVRLFDEENVTKWKVENQVDVFENCQISVDLLLTFRGHFVRKKTQRVTFD